MQIGTFEETVKDLNAAIAVPTALKQLGEVMFGNGITRSIEEALELATEPLIVTDKQARDLRALRPNIRHRNHILQFNDVFQNHAGIMDQARLEAFCMSRDAYSIAKGIKPIFKIHVRLDARQDLTDMFNQKLDRYIETVRRHVIGGSNPVSDLTPINLSLEQTLHRYLSDSELLYFIKGVNVSKNRGDFPNSNGIEKLLIDIQQAPGPQMLMDLVNLTTQRVGVLYPLRPRLALGYALASTLILESEGNLDPNELFVLITDNLKITHAESENGTSTTESFESNLNYSNKFVRLLDLPSNKSESRDYSEELKLRIKYFADDVMDRGVDGEQLIYFAGQVSDEIRRVRKTKNIMAFRTAFDDFCLYFRKYGSLPDKKTSAEIIDSVIKELKIPKKRE